MDVTLLNELEKQANVLSDRMNDLRVLRAKGALKFNEWMEFFRLREKLHGIYVKLINPNHLVIYDVKVWGFQYSKETNVGKLIRALKAKGLLYEIDLDAKTIKFYSKGKLQLPVRTLDVAVVSGTTEKPRMAPIELKTEATLLREAPAELVSDNFRSGRKRKRLGDQIAKEKWLKQLAKQNKITYVIYEGKNIDRDWPTVNKIRPDDVKLSAPTSYTRPGKALFNRIRQTLRPRISKVTGGRKGLHTASKANSDSALGNLGKKPLGKNKPGIELSPTRIARKPKGKVKPKIGTGLTRIKRPSYQPPLEVAGVGRIKTTSTGVKKIKSSPGMLRGGKLRRFGKGVRGGVGAGIFIGLDILLEVTIIQDLKNMAGRFKKKLLEIEKEKIERAIYSKKNTIKWLINRKRKEGSKLLRAGLPVYAEIQMDLRFIDQNSVPGFFKQEVDDDDPLRYEFDYIEDVDVKITERATNQSTNLIKKQSFFLGTDTFRHSIFQRIIYSVLIQRGMTDQERKLSNRLGTPVFIDAIYDNKTGLPVVDGVSDKPTRLPVDQ